MLAYTVAVMDRTTLGVVGLDAAKRFGATPAVLSTFVVLQLVVYAAAQIPAGVLLDRFGSRAMILVGGALMLLGQLTMAFTESLPAAIGARAVVGLGDAFTFVSVVRLVPHWFPPRQVPLVTQLTGISGQMGQILSAVPFLGLMVNAGWTVAFSAVAALGGVSLMVTALFVRNAPHGAVLDDPVTDLVRRDANFAKLGLTDADVATVEQVADVLAEHFALLQRPILVKDGRAIIGRPKDRVAVFLS